MRLIEDENPTSMQIIRKQAERLQFVQAEPNISANGAFVPVTLRDNITLNFLLNNVIVHFFLKME